MPTKQTQAVGGDSAPPVLLTLAEAASLCRTSPRTWRSWDAAGRVPRAIRIGRTKLWRAAELTAWIAAGCPRRAHWQWPTPIAANEP